MSGLPHHSCSGTDWPTHNYGVLALPRHDAHVLKACRPDEDLLAVAVNVELRPTSVITLEKEIAVGLSTVLVCGRNTVATVVTKMC